MFSCPLTHTYRMQQTYLKASNTMPQPQAPAGPGILGHCPDYFESCVLISLEQDTKIPYIACLHMHTRTYSVQCSDKIRFSQLRIKCGVAKSCPGTHTALQAPMATTHAVFGELAQYVSYDVIVHSSRRCGRRNTPVLVICSCTYIQQCSLVGGCEQCLCICTYGKASLSKFVSELVILLVYRWMVGGARNETFLFQDTLGEFANHSYTHAREWLAMQVCGCVLHGCVTSSQCHTLPLS